jgi:uncharacterized membrane protein
MHEDKEAAQRLAAYSDAVFAVIVTIMVLELEAPDEPAFSALWPLWPTMVSYAVSYLFIAIIWINHHYLMRFVSAPTLGLIWINFVHLFMVSLLPFATAWVARTKLASSPVAFYAGLFVCIDIAYNVFERDVLARAEIAHLSERAADRPAAIAHRVGDLHDRDPGGVRCATARRRVDLRRPPPPCAAGRHTIFTLTR